MKRLKVLSLTLGVLVASMVVTPLTATYTRVSAAETNKVWIEEKGHWENVTQDVWVPKIETVIVEPERTERVFSHEHFTFADGFETDSMEEAEKHSFWLLENDMDSNFQNEDVYVNKTIPAVTKEVDNGHYEKRVVDRKWVVDVPAHWEEKSTTTPVEAVKPETKPSESTKPVEENKPEDMKKDESKTEVMEKEETKSEDMKKDEVKTEASKTMEAKKVVESKMMNPNKAPKTGEIAGLSILGILVMSGAFALTSIQMRKR